MSSSIVSKAAVNAVQNVTAALLVIGDEILSGRTNDVNIAFIASKLTETGILLEEVRVVPDRVPRIVDALNALRAAHDYVFTTGGIGPTHDDVTGDAIAAAFGVSIEVDPRAVAEMRKRYDEAEMTPARLRMARIPHGADLIENEVSRAPGFVIGNVIVMAGVPQIMQAMLRAVTPRLRHGPRLISRSVRVDAQEGDVAPVLAALQAEWSDVPMGSYPNFENSRRSVTLVLRSADADRLDRACASLEQSLAKEGMKFGPD